MVRVIMHGCNGVMGQVITKMAKDMDVLTIVAGIDLKNDKENEMFIRDRLYHLHG